MNETKLIQVLISPHRSRNFVTWQNLLKGSFRELSSLSPGFRDFYGLNCRRLLSYISTCDARKSVFFFSRNTVHGKYIIKFKFCQLNSGLFSFLFASELPVYIE